MPRNEIRIAIQKDALVHANGERQSFSARWQVLAQAQGVQADLLNVRSPGFLQKLRGYDGFMWRYGYLPYPRQLARRLLPAIEHGMGIPVFPSWETAWTFEDKIAQTYLLEAAGIPSARTWIFWKREEAMAFAERCTYPLVAKLYYGFQSRNVQIVRDRDACLALIDRLFGAGMTGFGGGRPNLQRSELHHGYFYVQEFLEGNSHDTRVTVIGNRAYAFRRRNRPDDFRASGSGLIDWDPSEVDPAFVQLAYQVADRLRTQSVAIDGLYREGKPIVNEISYTYASWAIRDCPGHWARDADGSLRWMVGSLRAEDAIFEDFLRLVHEHRERRETQA